ncbi:hypothetical protein FM042_01340 [Aliidiomarina halalkaliphila]|uniref:Uncharacterized protein n=1 Tax=Aliidiomarina halalkaliphila TaxID=2593535 RepID=A0A552X3D6_9GAMM|nr:hypothetical protein [Aliidiomarina halalkaliphila]TRW49537.1 hypothetical protein FM042_01340 [Aliidiomarina halalkaliphila]
MAKNSQSGQTLRPQIQRVIALVTAPVGLIFLLSDAQDLLSFIRASGLSWYAVFAPLAWGILLGALAGLLRLDWVQKVSEYGVWASTALMTFGAVGSLAIYFEHRVWYLAWPTMWLAVLGLGIFAFFAMQVRFASKVEASAKRKTKDDN